MGRVHLYATGLVANSSQCEHLMVLRPCSRVLWQCLEGVLDPPPTTRAPSTFLSAPGLEIGTLCFSGSGRTACWGLVLEAEANYYFVKEINLVDREFKIGRAHV